jgi:hypothetical protein
VCLFLCEKGAQSTRKEEEVTNSFVTPIWPNGASAQVNEPENSLSFFHFRVEGSLSFIFFFTFLFSSFWRKKEKEKKKKEKKGDCDRSI